ncbi:Gfo/Idh/MocA family oxidoreductase [Brachybacterium sp. FME24]|uniref:Gfo/Idh/MocA family oxidoreductase n=1 Tax=Brachybacterium sp. FME24 TaxID=2742605 RepID=UPI001D0379B9|nr:Gfo/Idh/MocA family oxidoreductase [Brachybacterium sp. FME24]
MPKTLNIAVIGAGTMAQAVHLPVLRRRWDRYAVTALVDHSPRRRRESSEVWGLEEDKRYESVADLIAAVRAKTVSIDAALLSTDGLHVEDLLQLMRRGIPVLVEPPLGFSEQEIAKIADFERMTGRRLVMMAYPQQYDDSVSRMAEQIATKDLRMVDHEVLMPASQPLFGGAHVTTSSYDLPSEVRSQRRTELQSAVVAGSGDGATQRDRDLYVKGLLTGVAHQLAVLEAVYGPIARLAAVRHWPKGVIPGSIELLGELDGGAQVRLVWHYLPFAPEYSEHIQVLSARRRMRVELPAPSHGDRRSTVSLREKKSGVVQETATTATKGAAEAMWEAFHAFVEKGVQPLSGAEEARAQVSLLREVLSTIVVTDGRSLEADPAEESDPVDESDRADGAESVDGDEPVEGENPTDEVVPASQQADEDETGEQSGIAGQETAASEPSILVTAPADPAQDADARGATAAADSVEATDERGVTDAEAESSSPGLESSSLPREQLSSEPASEPSPVPIEEPAAVTLEQEQAVQAVGADEGGATPEVSASRDADSAGAGSEGLVPPSDPLVDAWSLDDETDGQDGAPGDRLR